MMFIAHMPAGFLLSRQFLKRDRKNHDYVKYLLIGMFASIAPDFDLAYFYLIDGRQHAHHSYWTHIPFYWLSVYLLLLYPVSRLYGRAGVKAVSLFLLGGLLHMSLDSIASGIKWLYPFDTGYHGIWRIPAIYDWWLSNYLFHWTFLLELLISALAIFVFVRDRPLGNQIIIQLKSWLNKLRPKLRQKRTKEQVKIN